jgi:very-short-patch-repair endonuclease
MTKDQAPLIPPLGGGCRAQPDGWGFHRPLETIGKSKPRRLRKMLTPQEVKLWNWLRESMRPQGYHFRRQVPIDRFIVDFACLKAKLIIEIDGGGHGTDSGQAADAARDHILEARGFRVLRFWNHDIDFQKVVVMDTILAALESML